MEWTVRALPEKINLWMSAILKIFRGLAHLPFNFGKNCWRFGAISPFHNWQFANSGSKGKGGEINSKFQFILPFIHQLKI
jgi:hypothetical protein